MKTTIVIIGLCVAVMEHAWAQTNQIAAPMDTNAPIKTLPVPTPDEITTIGGAVYKNFRIERVDPGGLTVSFSMAGGGLGMTKITFDQLSSDWQRVYGYDAQAAAEFQSGEKQAAGQWAAKMAADEWAAKIIKAEKEKQGEEAAKEATKETAKETATEPAKPADEEEKIKAAELAAQAAQKAAEEAMFRATNLPVPKKIIMAPPPHGD
jgi:hypothetical protein